MCYEKEHGGRNPGKKLDFKPFRDLEKSCDSIVTKNTKELNKELLDMRKKGRYRLSLTKR